MPITGTLTLDGLTVTGTLTVDETVITGTLQTVPTVVNGTLSLTVGPAGPAGEDGAAGPQGPQGIQGETGPQGVQGIQGETGATGPAGSDGVDGEGVPVGGTSGQLLAKIDANDYNTEWVDAPTGGGGGGGDIQVVSDDITRAADGVSTYTDIPELSMTVALGETKHLWYTLYYDEKSEGIQFQITGVGRFNSGGFNPSPNYFYDTSQAVGRAASSMRTTFNPNAPSPVTFVISDSISNAPINALLIRAMVHAPFEDVTVNIGFRATASGGSTLELKKGSSLEIK
jgi:hypothetical protein